MTTEGSRATVSRLVVSQVGLSSLTSDPDGSEGLRLGSLTYVNAATCAIFDPAIGKWFTDRT
jgi:hypothetical protein